MKVYEIVDVLSCMSHEVEKASQKSYFNPQNERKVKYVLYVVICNRHDSTE